MKYLLFLFISINSWAYSNPDIHFYYPDKSVIEEEEKNTTNEEIKYCIKRKNESPIITMAYKDLDNYLINNTEIDGFFRMDSSSVCEEDQFDVSFYCVKLDDDRQFFWKISKSNESDLKQNFVKSYIKINDERQCEIKE